MECEQLTVGTKGPWKDGCLQLHLSHYVYVSIIACLIHCGILCSSVLLRVYIMIVTLFVF